MSTIDPQAVAQRIDTVLDIPVAGDYHSAIRNLEILKSELLAQDGADNAPKTDSLKRRGSLNPLSQTSFRFIN